MQLDVELQHITPAIWRRLVVSAEDTLNALHDILQVARGWTDSQLHDFQVADARFGMVEVAQELLLVDERAAPIGGGCPRRDDGRLPVRLRRRLEATRSRWRASPSPAQLPSSSSAPWVPVLVHRRLRRCARFRERLRILADPSDEKHRHMKKWIGRGYDPEKLDVDEVYEKLGIARRLERQARAARSRLRSR